MTKILGIDFGIHGGLAIIELNDGVIALCGILMTIIEPIAWKKFHGLRGGEKEAGQRALQLFPAAHGMLARRKDHGRAEAALIALAGNGGKP
jgi:crossover junction endodeoxyribonuclease RuvC